MIKPDTYTKSPARHTAGDCCTDLTCESGLKNNFFEGKRLTPDMFQVEQRYAIERRRLLNRAIHGWGVVYGYGIGIEPGRNSKRSVDRALQITSGLALDACGRELLYLGKRCLQSEDVTVVDEDGKRVARGDVASILAQMGHEKDPQTGRSRLCWLLSVHYAEQYTEMVRTPDPCRCDHEEWDRTCETVRFTLTRIDCDKCCDDCGCELECGCGSGRCCDPVDRDDPKHPRHPKYPDDPRKPLQRGGCECLCHHLAELEVCQDCSDHLCEIDEACGRVRVDLVHGVPLACVELVPDGCGDWTFGDDIDMCGPRRLVKRNDLLFDLIRGCDLTRIEAIGWRPFHREAVKFDDFSHAFGADAHGEPEYITRDFWVTFTRPVREETLQPDCFSITIMTGETHDYWWDVYRVPISRIEYIPAKPGDPAHHVRGAKIVVDGRWVHGALRGESRIFSYDTQVEIEVRGDFIVDCNGQTVDANAIGLSATRTGNGTPGGTFLSAFRVAPREPYGRQPQPGPAEPKGASS